MTQLGLFAVFHHLTAAFPWTAMAGAAGSPRCIALSGPSGICRCSQLRPNLARQFSYQTNAVIAGSCVSRPVQDPERRSVKRGGGNLRKIYCNRKQKKILLLRFPAARFSLPAPLGRLRAGGARALRAVIGAPLFSLFC